MDTPVTITLIFANVAITLWSMYSNPVYFDRFSERPYEIVYHKRYYQAITSAFLHANFLHLFFNMFALYSFGTILEKFFIVNLGNFTGSLDFFLIYFISLLSGSLLTVIFHFKNSDYVAVGASGAVSGIIFSFILFFPTSTVGVFFIPMPAFIFAFLYIGVSIYGVKSKFGNIGHEAHLGGAIGGVISTFLLIEGSLKFFLHHFK
jgi:membrane associated rhomboid family serine protease